MNNKNNLSTRETTIQQGRLGSRSFAAPHTFLAGKSFTGRVEKI